MGSDRAVNLIEFNNIDRIHAVGGSPKAIPTNPDPVWLSLKSHKVALFRAFICHSRMMI